MHVMRGWAPYGVRCKSWRPGADQRRGESLAQEQLQPPTRRNIADMGVKSVAPAAECNLSRRK